MKKRNFPSIQEGMDDMHESKLCMSSGSLAKAVGVLKKFNIAVPAGDSNEATVLLVLIALIAVSTHPRYIRENIASSDAFFLVTPLIVELLNSCRGIKAAAMYTNDDRRCRLYLTHPSIGDVYHDLDEYEIDFLREVHRVIPEVGAQHDAKHAITVYLNNR